MGGAPPVGQPVRGAMWAFCPAEAVAGLPDEGEEWVVRRLWCTESSWI